MSGDEVTIHLDPVGDGKPSIDFRELVFIVFFTVFGVWYFYSGKLLFAANLFIFAGHVVIAISRRRAAWDAGYYTGAQSVCIQLASNSKSRVDP